MSTNTQVAKLQYLIRSAALNIDLKLSVPMILTLATEISAIIENEGLVLCWMSDFEDQLKAVEAKDAAK